ncbi:MAG: hypothetical protein ACI8ZM_003491 [Crocinitomix sp.]|jgi:hypothetical protein
MRKQNMKLNLFLIIVLTISIKANTQTVESLSPYVLIVQPIILQSDEGTFPASMVLPEELVDRAYSKAGVDFHFFEPIYFNNTKARDGLINLDSIVVIASKEGYIKGQHDIVNMFFVNSIDGDKGPLGRGMLDGNITFISLGSDTEEKNINMQAFVIAHEVGHNLSLKHAIDDINVPNSIPNIQGDGEYKDRIDPKYSLNQYQIDIIHQSQLIHSRIDFLEKKRASLAILDESYEPYFSQLEKREIEAFTNSNVPSDNIDTIRDYAKEKFSTAVLDFTDDEKECISYVVNKVNYILLKNGISMMARQPWRFIKIEDWLCGGFAHTRGTYIILSQKHINHLTKTWSNNMSMDDEQKLVEDLGGLLVHEQMHSLQRTFKSKFNNLYTKYWGFVKAQVVADISIKKNQVSNPDAPIAEWLISNPQDTNSFYWIRTLLKEKDGIPAMGADFMDRVFVIKNQNGIYSTVKGKDGILEYTTLDSIDFYKNAFPTSRGLDHPNEISAYMFSDYFKSLASKSTYNVQTSGKASANLNLFIEWVENEMK